MTVLHYMISIVRTFILILFIMSSLNVFLIFVYYFAEHCIDPWASRTYDQFALSTDWVPHANEEIKQNQKQNKTPTLNNK